MKTTREQRAEPLKRYAVRGLIGEFGAEVWEEECETGMWMRANAALADLESLEAENRGLREALEEADDELVNLQPHIPQSCLPGMRGFIDAHVDQAMTTLRTALTRRKEQ